IFTCSAILITNTISNNNGRKYSDESLNNNEMNQYKFVKKNNAEIYLTSKYRLKYIVLILKFFLFCSISVLSLFFIYESLIYLSFSIFSYRYNISNATSRNVIVFIK